ncbi:hypothetical protein ACLHWQ_12415 [Flavobacterium psychrophilum]
MTLIHTRYVAQFLSGDTISGDNCKALLIAKQYQIILISNYHSKK